MLRQLMVTKFRKGWEFNSSVISSLVNTCTIIFQ
jgi:hypothetical protein